MYLKKTTKYGNRIDTRKYHTFKCPGKDCSRSERRKPTKEKIAEANERRAIKKMMMLIMENFDSGDWHLTLTYASEERPDAAGAKKKLRNLFTKLRRAYRAAGLELKYFVVPEFENKNIHHHVVITDIPGIQKLLRKFWTWGGIHLTPLYDNKDFKGLVNYLVKETKNTFRKEGNPFKQRWSCSRNLRKPEVHRTKVNANSWREEPTVPPSLTKQGYVLDKTSIVVGVDAMGYPFQEYTMIRYEKKERRR